MHRIPVGKRSIQPRESRCVLDKWGTDGGRRKEFSADSRCKGTTPMFDYKINGKRPRFPTGVHQTKRDCISTPR